MKKFLSLSATGLFLVSLTVSVSPAGADYTSTSCSTSKYGKSSYTSCSNGISSSTTSYGNSSYTSYSNGTSCSSTKYGSSSYSSCSNGISSSTTSYGNSSYSSISGTKKTCPYGRVTC